MKPFLLFDASSYLYRAYHAMGAIANQAGEATGALFGFIRAIKKIVDEERPAHLAVVFDGPHNSASRRVLFPDYKANRPEAPKDLIDQLLAARDFCRYIGYPFLSVEGVEADDTLATLASWAVDHHRMDVHIYSSDKDLCQLVNRHISLYQPSQKQKELVVVTPQQVVEKYGIAAEQFIDYLALVGDTSDNIPGIRGIGPKGAAELLAKYGSLEALYAAIDAKVSFPQKLLQKLIDGRSVAFLSQQLAALNHSVECGGELSLARFELGTPDQQFLEAFYREKGFRSLLRAPLVAPAGGVDLAAGVSTPLEPTASEAALLSHGSASERSLAELFSALEAAARSSHRGGATPCLSLVLSAAGSGTPVDILPKAIGCAFSTSDQHFAWVAAWSEHHAAQLQRLFDLPGIVLCGHDLKSAAHLLANGGVRLSDHLLSGHSFDLMVASSLIYGDRYDHSLEAIAASLEEPRPLCEDELSNALQQVASLYPMMKKLLVERQLFSLFTEVEMALLPLLFKMERVGMFLDLHRLEEIGKALAEGLERCQATINRWSDLPINLNSPKQLQQLLLSLGLPLEKKTKTGFSTDAEVLETLVHHHPMIAHLLEYRQMEKLRSTYVDALPRQISPLTLRLHPTFSQTTAATGRLSCRSPNLQNIPIRGRWGPLLRSAFTLQQTGWSFIAADYSQIELRLLAHLSEDPRLVAAFLAGEDIHLQTAMEVFSADKEEVTGEMRRQAKTVNFGILYGQQAFGLARQLGIPLSAARDFIERYFLVYQGVRSYLDRSIAECAERGYATTLTGRQRPLPDIRSRNRPARAAAERMAINTPVQGTCADLIKQAMIQVMQSLQSTGSQARLVLQIHDELLFEVPDSELSERTEQIKRLMEGVMPLCVPLVVDLSVGKNWGEC